MSGLTHLDADGAAHMVDVADKAPTQRQAIATGRIDMSDAAVEAIRSGAMKKGDVLAVARVAGIMAAKRTSDIIPLCHPIAITRVSVDLTLDDRGVQALATVSTHGRTGVEMEALTAVSGALLTLYDMAKAVDRSMTIRDIHVVHKAGGRSGDWTAAA